VEKKMTQENITNDNSALPKAPIAESVASSGERFLKTLLPLALALLLISATVWSLGIFGLTTYQDYLSIPTEVVVPEVKDLEIKEAYEVIEEAGLKLQVHESRYDKKVQKRVVLSQDPAGGRKVRKGRTILVVVSLGPELIPVPKITGESLRTAKIALSNSKLRIGKVTFDEASYGQDEEVVKQNPSAGKEVPRGQEIHLTVRRGWH
jgi:eukaryotic-like serine/threonine-protein kinase